MAENTHKVLYRKYRPKRFSEIIGQEHVVRTLQGALVLGQLAHAYLFAGPRGTGKTTVAHLLAKAANCTHASAAPEEKTFEACNECALCSDFLAGRALDLFEIDAASNRGIDDVRALREGIRFSPAQAKFKTYIIDEVHMLTKEAFNALLKTLEEPPPHALFILATTEVQKVPATVLSRCQRFDFHRLPFEKIRERLRGIAAAEKVSVDEEALALMIHAADGSARDAETLFDQVLSAGGKSVDAKEVAAILGVADSTAVENFASMLARKDTERCLRAIAELLEAGGDPNQFCRLLVHYLRDLVILSVEPRLGELLARQRGKEHVERAQKIASTASTEDFKRFLEAFLEAHAEIRFSPLPQLPLELAAIEVTAPPEAGNLKAQIPNPK